MRCVRVAGCLLLREWHRHGYDFLFFQMETTTCSHPTFGARHPSYCKLAAIGEALARRAYQLLLFLHLPRNLAAAATAMGRCRDELDKRLLDSL